MTDLEKRFIEDKKGLKKEIQTYLEEDDNDFIKMLIDYAFSY